MVQYTVPTYLNNQTFNTNSCALSLASLSATSSPKKQTPISPQKVGHDDHRNRVDTGRRCGENLG